MGLRPELMTVQNKNSGCLLWSCKVLSGAMRKTMEVSWSNLISERLLTWFKKRKGKKS